MEGTRRRLGKSDRYKWRRSADDFALAKLALEVTYIGLGGPLVRRFLALLAFAALVVLGLYLSILGAAAAGRYFADGCSGHDPWTSDCADAFYSMLVGGGAISVILLLVCFSVVSRLRRRRQES